MLEMLLAKSGAAAPSNAAVLPSGAPVSGGFSLLLQTSAANLVGANAALSVPEEGLNGLPGNWVAILPQSAVETPEEGLEDGALAGDDGAPDLATTPELGEVENAVLLGESSAVPAAGILLTASPIDQVAPIQAAGKTVIANSAVKALAALPVGGTTVVPLALEAAQGPETPAPLAVASVAVLAQAGATVDTSTPTVAVTAPQPPVQANPVVLPTASPLPQVAQGQIPQSMPAVADAPDLTTSQQAPQTPAAPEPSPVTQKILPLPNVQGTAPSSSAGPLEGTGTQEDLSAITKVDAAARGVPVAQVPFVKELPKRSVTAPNDPLAASAKGIAPVGEMDDIIPPSKPTALIASQTPTLQTAGAQTAQTPTLQTAGVQTAQTPNALLEQLSLGTAAQTAGEPLEETSLLAANTLTAQQTNPRGNPVHQMYDPGMQKLPSKPVADALMSQVKTVDMQEGRTTVHLQPRGLGAIEVEMFAKDDVTSKVIVRVENLAVLQTLREERQMLAMAIGVTDSSVMSLEEGTPNEQSFGGSEGDNDPQNPFSSDTTEAQTTDHQDVVDDGVLDVLA